MPLDRLVLILVCVAAAAGVTIWIAQLVFVAIGLSPVAALAIGAPTALVLYIAVRIIADRVGNAEDDHYDGIEK